MKRHVSSDQELLKQRLLDQADKKLLKNNLVAPLLYVHFTFYLLIFGDGDGMHAYGGYRETSLSSEDNSNRKNKRIRDSYPDNFKSPGERPVVTCSLNLPEPLHKRLKVISQLCESFQSLKCKVNL